MNKITFSIIILTSLFHNIYGQVSEEKKNSYGILFMAGGRYDDMRMCVASDAGAKGGAVADIMFIAKHELSENKSVSFNLPVMRPILFGLAFEMLQFEPEITLEFRKDIGEKRSLITAPGLGVSLHYGPDYKSDLDNRGESFFAMGPFFSFQTGIAFKKEDKIKKVLGLKAFYAPLFSTERSTGTVLGGALVYTYYF